MSFISNLTKDFIRSAVRQVGRDSGRVISNTVYKDKHAIPIRHVGNNNTNTSNNTTIYNNIDYSTDNLRQELIGNGYEAILFESRFISNVLLLIVTFIIPFIPCFYWLLVAFRDLRKKHTLFKNFQTKTTAELMPTATNSERNIYIIKGIIALFIAVFSFYYWYIVISALWS